MEESPQTQLKRAMSAQRKLLPTLKHKGAEVLFRASQVIPR